MVKGILNKLNEIYDKQIDGTGLALFRICFSLVLLLEILHKLYFRHLVYDGIPYIIESQINYALIFIIWIIVLFGIIVGLYTRFFTIISYIFTVLFLNSLNVFHDHMHYMFTGIGLLMVLLPVGQSLSLDRLRWKLKYSSSKFEFTPVQTVSQLYYYAVLFFGVGVVYMDSMIFKMSSYLWTEGLGVWLPSSLPMVSHLDIDFIDNNEFLVRFLGYFTMFFEAVFLFIFWRKKWRIITFIIGFSLHFGILLEFPIPYFALGVMAMYILQLPIKFWSIFKIKHRPKKLTVYYRNSKNLSLKIKLFLSFFDVRKRVEFIVLENINQNTQTLELSEEELRSDLIGVDLKNKIYLGKDLINIILKNMIVFYPLFLMNKVKLISFLLQKVISKLSFLLVFNHFDTDSVRRLEVTPDSFSFNNLQLRRKLVFFCFSVLCVMQFLVSFQSVLTRYPLIGNNTLAKTIVANITKFKITSLSTKFTGITPHAVFMDEVMANYNHIVSVYYINDKNEEVRLPIINEDGSPDWYIYVGHWVNWSFVEVVTANVVQSDLEKGLRRYSAFWAHQNDVDLIDAKFIIKVKKIDYPKEWSKNFCKIQREAPWVYGGEIIWKNKEMTTNLRIIEDIE